MVKAPIPKRLNRNGIKQAFPRVSCSAWRNYFDREKDNGLFELRVIGPNKNAYYDVEKLMSWLVERNLYCRTDFKQPGELLFDSPVLSIRTHLIGV